MAGPLGFEPRVHGIKTRCLTAWLWPNDQILIYVLNKKGRPVGIEPTCAGATIRCVNHFATTAILAGVVGIEPTSKVLETFVLPLNYTPMKFYKWWRGADSNCRTLRERIYSPPRLATSLPLHED